MNHPLAKKFLERFRPLVHEREYNVTHVAISVESACSASLELAGHRTLAFMRLDHTKPAPFAGISDRFSRVLGQDSRVLAAEQISQSQAAAMLFHQMCGNLVLPRRAGAVHARADHIARRSIHHAITSPELWPTTIG